MSKNTPARRKRKTTAAMSDRDLFELAEQFETAKERTKKYENDPVVGWRSIQGRIVAELKRRKVKSLKDTSLKTITLVAPETVVYHEEEIWSELSPAKRRLVFDRQINLARLPKDVQTALLAHLTPAQRRTVVSHSLNVDRLAEAVAAGRVTTEFVAKHSEIKESAPYIKVSQGEA